MSPNLISSTSPAYVFHPEFPIESTINLAMLKRGLGAAEALAPGLQYVIFPTGTKVCSRFEGSMEVVNSRG